MIEHVLLFGIIIVAALQAAFYILFLRSTAGLPYNKDGITHRCEVPRFAMHPFSVVICAGNEAASLHAFLPKVLGQHYCFEDGSPAFEVIVVNDSSSDNTDDVLSALALAHAHLRVVSLPANEVRPYPGKKAPLSKGLAAASHTWIACIDADCAPATDVWLHGLAAPLLAGKEIAIGYGGYVLQKGLVNAFTRFETVHTFLLYYTLTKAGFPYMAVGRNLAATKQVFLRAQAHPLWSVLPSGDDDLLIRICATPHNVGIVSHPVAFTWTASKRTLKDYLAQKQRHVSTGKFYSIRTKTLLTAYALGVCLPVPIAVVSLLVLHNPLLAGWNIVFLWLLADRFREGALWMWEKGNVAKWIAFFLCWPLYNAVLAPYILWKTKRRWK